MAQQELLRILECPTCFEIMIAPIYICSAGHSICSKCKVKVRHCPTCRGLFNARRRNYSLEHLSAIILHPCPHEGNGCTELIKYQDLNNHANTCCFRQYHCIMEECDFKAPRDALKKHVEENHTVISWMRANSEHTWHPTRPAFDTQIALCYNEMFYFHRCLVNNITMYWTCQFLGKSEDAANFTFKITIDDGYGRKYSYSDRCQPDILTLSDVILSGHCLAMPVTVLKSFLNPEKVILYTVTIERTSGQKHRKEIKY